MSDRMTSARSIGLALVAAALTVGVAACGQSDPAQDGAREGAGSTAGVAPSAETATSGVAAPGTDPAASGTAPVPGPDATTGCDSLTGPVFALIERSTSGEDTAAASEDVRRVASGVDDNALSAVASRLSGLTVQPEVDDDAVMSEWGQFRQLCDID